MILKKNIICLKTDVQNSVFPRLKNLRCLKNLKSNILFSLKKKNVRLSKLLSKKLLFFRKNNNFSKNLNFKAKNSRNVFTRTKRKSSYGQTLQEAQKFKIYTSFSKHVLKNVYQKQKQNFIPYIEKLPSIVLNHSNMYENTSLSNFLGTTSIVPNQLNFITNNKMSIPLLYHLTRKHKNKKCLIFTKPFPNLCLIDFRINKIKIVSTRRTNYPFALNLNKVLQHFRLKRI